ncbi:amidohydrolase family protein [Dyella choica]|uniref:amidohydrolase family protein n=1 Tax=Dyella choica TaxID=1927959 RepID=UPI00131527C2|nr:amidohydrolase family protein [Dyella choica]
MPLKTQFTAADIRHPLTLKSEGKAARGAPMHDQFTLDPNNARVTLLRDGKASDYPVGEHTFLIDGYSPVAMQQMLLRYWMAKGRPAHISAPPEQDIHIQSVDDLDVQLGGKRVKLHGYVISGLVWGSETAWLDDDQRLAAVVTTDAEFDHFEAVRDTFEPVLDTFIQRAVANNLDALAQLTSKDAHASAKKLLITHVTLIDGAGGPPQRDRSVYVENGRIVRIEATGELPKAASDLEVLDGSGKYLIPGLWDMHAHYEQVEWGPIYLASGVTTVRDCGNEFSYITAVRDALQSGRGIGPRLLIAGLVDGTGPITLGAVIADTPEQAREIVHRYKDIGALQIKVYSSVKPELVPIITEEAHKLGMTVTGHVPSGMTSAEVVKDGFDSINHIQYIARDLLHIERGKPMPPLDFETPSAKEQLALFKQHHTVFDDTTVIYELAMHPQGTPIRAFEPGIDHVAKPLAQGLNEMGAPAEQSERLTKYYQDMLATLRELHRQGLTLMAGTDQSVPGYSLHRELELYVQAGFTPYEALQAATSVPAHVMGLDKDTGTLQVGKRADMVLLSGDPLSDIRNTRQVFKTIASGVVYDPAPLWESVGFTP